MLNPPESRPMFIARSYTDGATRRVRGRAMCATSWTRQMYHSWVCRVARLGASPFARFAGARPSLGGGAPFALFRCPMHSPISSGTVFPRTRPPGGSSLPISSVCPDGAGETCAGLCHTFPALFCQHWPRRPNLPLFLRPEPGGAFSLKGECDAI